jgi:hypothetical protein
MGRQLPPSHLKVPPGPHAFPQRYSLGDTIVVNQFAGFEKAIPAIPSLPGFRTSAGMFVLRVLVVACLLVAVMSRTNVERKPHNRTANTCLQHFSHP